MMRRLWLIIATSIMVSEWSPSWAAVINKNSLGDINFITIEGPIVIDDLSKFEGISSSSAEFSSGPTVVMLNSPGGNLITGLAIGETIRANRLSTAVMNGSECTSICALIWLAGTKRYLGTSAKVGFHAAYSGTEADAKEVGEANAFVGAYLSKLGLSYAAIAFATEAAPGEMQWLHPSDAERIGIQLDLVPDGLQNSPSSQSPRATESDEQQARSVVASYYELWSRAGTDVESLSAYYGDTAKFYGAVTTREKIMDEKRRFSARWPIRHYTIKPNTLFAQCDDTCSVTGVVEWDVSSPERGAHSVGTANFVLKIALNNSDIRGIILSENGSVLAAHNDSLPSAQAALGSTGSDVSPAYAAGRQARLDYQAWFNGLPSGDFRDGAAFWAANRSLKDPPSCKQFTKPAQWWAGCFSAQARLSPIDARRHAEKNYWRGWNSL